MYLTNTATGGGGSATINVIGNSSQLIDGTAVSTNQSRLPLVNINKSSGILSLSGIISFASNVSYTAGTIDPTTSTFTIVRSLTISGSFTVYNLTVESAANVTVTIASGSTITASNDLNLGSGSNNLNINTGTLAAQGNINITNTRYQWGRKRNNANQWQRKSNHQYQRNHQSGKATCGNHQQIFRHPGFPQPFNSKSETGPTVLGTWIQTQIIPPSYLPTPSQ